MEIRKATLSDSKEILSLLRSFIGGASQWNEYYPNLEIVEEDIKNDNCYIMVNDNNEIISSIAIEEDDSDEVDFEGNKITFWDPNLKPVAGLGRLVVKEEYSNKGIAKEMITYCIKVLKERGYKGIHYLVKTGHTKALQCYSHFNFKYLGDVHMWGNDYSCYEKEI